MVRESHLNIRFKHDSNNFILSLFAFSLSVGLSLEHHRVPNHINLSSPQMKPDCSPLVLQSTPRRWTIDLGFEHHPVREDPRGCQEGSGFYSSNILLLDHFIPSLSISCPVFITFSFFFVLVLHVKICTGHFLIFNSSHFISLKVMTWQHPRARLKQDVMLKTPSEILASRDSSVHEDNSSRVFANVSCTWPHKLFVWCIIILALFFYLYKFLSVSSVIVIFFFWAVIKINCTDCTGTDHVSWLVFKWVQW